MDITRPTRRLLDVKTRHLPGGPRKYVNTSVTPVGTSVEFADTCWLQVKCYCWWQLNWPIFQLLFFLPWRQGLVGQGLLIMEDSWSNSDTPHSVGLLWTSDQPDTKTSTWKHTTVTTDIHARGAIRTRNLRKRTAADPHLRPRGHWVRQLLLLKGQIYPWKSSELLVFQEGMYSSFRYWNGFVLKESNNINKLTTGSYVDMLNLLQTCHMVQKSVKSLHRTEISVTRQPIGYHRWEHFALHNNLLLLYWQYWHHESHFFALHDEDFSKFYKSTLEIIFIGWYNDTERSF